MKTILRSLSVTILITAAAGLVLAQIGSEYKPKFPGDPARSETEAAAMGYMRVVVNAQKNYSHKHNGQYATSLAALVGQGSFTRRLERTDRGDYTVRFHSTGKAYSVALLPRQFDAAHRAFYLDESGEFRVEDTQPASKTSPELK